MSSGIWLDAITGSQRQSGIAESQIAAAISLCHILNFWIVIHDSIFHKSESCLGHFLKAKIDSARLLNRHSPSPYTPFRTLLVTSFVLSALGLQKYTFM